MQIESILKNSAGQVFRVIYRDIDEEKELNGKKVSGVHAYCFYDDKLVVVYAANKGHWSLPGGGVEPGEGATDAVKREILEETNMRVIKQELIGYQDIFEPEGTITQTRSFCLVEPIGDFVSDPDGDITAIKLIDPRDRKKYFDWGVVGDRLMERALEKLK